MTLRGDPPGHIRLDDVKLDHTFTSSPAEQITAAKNWVDAISAEQADPRETAIRKFCLELADLLVAKQKAYGPKAITEAPGGPLNGLAVRIFDKHARFQNLVEDGAAGDGVADEALEDTSMDLCGYSVITTLVLRGAW